MEAVLSTTSIEMHFFRAAGGSFCMAFTVAMPEGVAALPNPKRFAVRFIVTAFMTSGQCAASLNSSLVTGDSIRAMTAVMPAFSHIFISPPQRHIEPLRYMTSSTALLQPSREATDTAVMSPLRKPHNKADRDNITIITLNIISTPFS